MTTEGTRTKAEWRGFLHARRAQLKPEWVADASRAITREALDLPELAGATTVAAYLALPDEANLDALIAHLRDDGKIMLVPAFDRDARQYRLCHLGGDQVAAVNREGRDIPIESYAEDSARLGRRPCPTLALPQDDLIVGRFGVREPRHLRWADSDTPDFWLIPGVGFDRQGNRLGHGAGYYDRLLAKAPGIRAGIAFAFQVLDGLAVEAHDVGMNLVITEQGTHRI